MSLPKKGSRNIVVGGTNYRWLIRKKPTYCAGNALGMMTVAIELANEDSGGVLLVNTGIYRPDNWYKPNQTAVTPGVIRKMIEGAIEAGWNDESHETYRFEYQLIPDGENE
jgi:hypothetical protein